eukprot:805899-Alexandrium_andersonii.AAC.1
MAPLAAATALLLLAAAGCAATGGGGGRHKVTGQEAGGPLRGEPALCAAQNSGDVGFDGSLTAGGGRLHQQQVGGGGLP